MTQYNFKDTLYTNLKSFQGLDVLGVKSLGEHLAENGYRVTFVPVDREGRLDLDYLYKHLTDEQLTQANPVTDGATMATTMAIPTPAPVLPAAHTGSALTALKARLGSTGL